MEVEKLLNFAILFVMRVPYSNFFHSVTVKMFGNIWYRVRESSDGAVVPVFQLFVHN